MRKREALILLGVLGTAAAAGAFTFGPDWLRPWVRSTPAPSANAEDEHGHDHDHGAGERVRLTAQARANLGLVARPLQPQTYSRTIQVPGMIVERPGKSDRGVTTPISGVITRVAAVPGEAVRAGDELFSIRLISENLQTSQAELFKTTRELQITQEQKQRLEKVAATIPEARLLELDYQHRRLTGTLQSLRYDLTARGLSAEQVQGIAEGKFVTEITIRVPVVPPATATLSPKDATGDGAKPPPFEVEDLKVQLGEQVQSGQTLCTLANHVALYVEGRVFKSEVPLVAKAAEGGWAVGGEFAAGNSGEWAPLGESLKVQFLANRVDPASQTVSVYAPLANQYREYTEGGQIYRVWRFRPGQRVRLSIPVEQFTDVFVLPLDAVVRDGADAYVFRQNGDSFDRKPVHVLYEDRRNAVIANDGSLNPGNYVAQNGAAPLNRALKAQAAGGEGHGGHDHAGHSHDH